MREPRLAQSLPLLRYVYGNLLYANLMGKQKRVEGKRECEEQ